MAPILEPQKSTHADLSPELELFRAGFFFLELRVDIILRKSRRKNRQHWIIVHYGQARRQEGNTLTQLAYISAQANQFADEPASTLQFAKGGGGGYSGGRANYQSIPKENEKLERFYNALGGISEEERGEFWEAIRRDLPSSFRFTGSRGYVRHGGGGMKFKISFWRLFCYVVVLILVTWMFKDMRLLCRNALRTSISPKSPRSSTRAAMSNRLAQSPGIRTSWPGG